jgi:rhodanese-related sulfurtransferase
MKSVPATLAVAVLAAVLLAPQPLTAQEEQAPSLEMCPDVVKDLVIEARESVRLVDMSTFKHTLDAKDYDLVVDVREPPEYAAGHIPGAINVPRGVIEFLIWKSVGFPHAIDKTKHIYLYCNTGGRASLSGKALVDLGFTHVTLVDMKLPDWIEVGLPLETSN